MMEKQVRREAGLEEDRTQKHIIAAHKELRRLSVLPGPNSFLSELIYFLIAFLYLAPKP